MNLSERIKTQPIPHLMAAMSAPAILSLLLNALNTVIDGIFVGRGVSMEALSAVSVSMGLVLVIQGFSLLVAAGTSASVALKLGAGDREGAERILGCSVILSLFLALGLTGAGLLALKPLLRLYGASADNLSLAIQYASVMIGGSLLLVLGQVANNALKGMGYAKRAFGNFLASILVNVGLNYLFIFVFRWGMTGAALSTVIGNGVCALLAVAFLTSKGVIAQLKLPHLRLRKETAREILGIGLPACIMQLALSMVSLTFNHSAAFWGGTTAVAAYGILYSVMMVIYMPIMGLGQGIQPIVGFNYSGAQYGRVRQTLLTATGWATGFSVVMFLLVEIFAPIIVGAFGGAQDRQLLTLAVPGLRLFSLLTPAVGLQMIGANYFQYVGKVKQSVLLSGLRQLVLVIPLALILPRFMGLTGIWLATPLADLAAFVVTVRLVGVELRQLKEKEKPILSDRLSSLQSADGLR